MLPIVIPVRDGEAHSRKYQADSVIQGGTLDGQKVEGKPAWAE
jgi:hypothetical protein